MARLLQFRFHLRINKDDFTASWIKSVTRVAHEFRRRHRKIQMGRYHFIQTYLPTGSHCLWPLTIHTPDWWLSFQFYANSVWYVQGVCVYRKRFHEHGNWRSIKDSRSHAGSFAIFSIQLDSLNVAKIYRFADRLLQDWTNCSTTGARSPWHGLFIVTNISRSPTKEGYVYHSSNRKPFWNHKLPASEIARFSCLGFPRRTIVVEKKNPRRRRNKNRRNKWKVSDKTSIGACYAKNKLNHEQNTNYTNTSRCPGIRIR